MENPSQAERGNAPMFTQHPEIAGTTPIRLSKAKGGSFPLIMIHPSLLIIAIESSDDTVNNTNRTIRSKEMCKHTYLRYLMSLAILTCL